MTPTINTTTIQADHGQKSLFGDFQTLYAYRELLYFFIWRDLKVRYRGALFGLTWLLIRPLSTVALFTLLLSVVTKLDTGDIPYPLFVLVAMLPWQCVVGCLAEGGNCMISHGPILSKVAFPRLAVPISAAAVQGIDLALAAACFLPFLFMKGGIGKAIEGGFLWLMPLWLFQLALLCVGLTCLISALIALYRDVRFMIPFFVQLGLFLSPVGYSVSSLPMEWRLIYALNPLVGVIEGMRLSLFGLSFEGMAGMFVVSFAASCILFIGGLSYFRFVERSLVDRM